MGGHHAPPGLATRAQKTTERTPMDLTARELASWAEDQDWQDRFWWPFHQKSTLRNLAYRDCVLAGECKGAESEDLSQYVIAGLETKGE
ncbi:MAG: hypothetical protein GY696_01220 [Gammaproteobacteria bacterium]|nr:hypothetical protein [Gammaproteobacteria bacterium]